MSDNPNRDFVSQRSPRLIWEEVRHNAQSRLSQSVQRTALENCFDGQFLYAQFAWTCTDARTARHPANTSDIAKRVADDLRPLFECLGIQLSFDRFGEPRCHIHNAQTRLAMWLLLVDKGTSIQNPARIDVTLGGCNGRFELEISDDCDPKFHQTNHDHFHIEANNPVRELISRLLPTAEIELLKCPQGGEVIQMIVPLSKTRAAA